MFAGPVVALLVAVVGEGEGGASVVKAGSTPRGPLLGLR